MLLKVELPRYSLCSVHLLFDGVGDGVGAKGWMRIKRLLLQVATNVDNEPNIGELPNVDNGYHVATNNPNSWPRSRPCS